MDLLATLVFIKLYKDLLQHQDAMSDNFSLTASKQKRQKRSSSDEKNRENARNRGNFQLSFELKNGKNTELKRSCQTLS